MANLRRKLPPLTGLTAFEAVARLRSFTKAASELGVTQAAVSRQIHLLEEGFGFPLFRRLHRKIELTERGQVLSNAATAGFNLIAEAVDDISREETSNALTISASVAFSHFWLLPRISSFSREHPETSIRIVSQDTTENLKDSEVDLAIRYGGGNWPDGRADLLFEDEIFPVCSAQYAEKVKDRTDLSELLNHPLISYDPEDPSWMGWNEWFAAFSIPAPKRNPGMRFSFYTEVIYATLNGNGIALGWKRILDGLLDQKSLVRLTTQSIVTRNGYFIIVPPRSAKNASATNFIKWLIDEAGSLPAAHGT